MYSSSLVFLAAAVVAAQNVPPPPPATLTSTMSGVLPVLPAGFTGVATNEGAIINQAPPNASYVGLGGPAQVQSNLPAATYTATLPSVPFDGLTGTVISGTVSGASTQGGSGVTFTINLSGFPDESQYGPFMYHIHDLPVPADGNCTSTMGHFDVTNVGEYYMCDTSAPQNCQVGDLAGKHGKIMASPFSTTFNEPYLSTDPSSPYFFGAKSIVIHTNNATRITCANFVSNASGGATGSPTTSAGISQISDGQPQAATSAAVSQISDNQPQAATSAAISQISDNQPQAATSAAVTQISDNQPQAATAAQTPAATPASTPAQYTGGAVAKIAPNVVGVAAGLVALAL